MGSRWPTVIEQGIGVLILVFIATACMAALFVGLGSNWFVNVLVFAFDSYKKTIAVAVAKIAKLEQQIRRYEEEIDERVRERDQAKRDLMDVLRERNAAQQSLAAAQKQVADVQAALDAAIEQRERNGQWVRELQKELHHLKHPTSEGQALVELAFIFLFVALICIGLLGLIGGFPTGVFTHITSGLTQ